MKKLSNFVIGLSCAVLAAVDVQSALQETGWRQVAFLSMALIYVFLAAHFIGKVLKEEETEDE